MWRPRSPPAPFLPDPPLPAPPAPFALLLSHNSILWHPVVPYGPLRQGGGPLGRKRQAAAAAAWVPARRRRHSPRPPKLFTSLSEPPFLPFSACQRFLSAPSVMLAMCADGGSSQRRRSCGLPHAPCSTVRARPAAPPRVSPPFLPPASTGILVNLSRPTTTLMSHGGCDGG